MLPGYFSTIVYTHNIRWNERESLKYLYATKFDHEKTIERIQKCIAWRNNPGSRTLTNDVLRLFVKLLTRYISKYDKETGALYMYGRDKQYRPIVVFDFGKVDFNEVANLIDSYLHLTVLDQRRRFQCGNHSTP